MNKIMTPRMIIVLLVTFASLYFVSPTFRYFLFVGGLPETPSAEQMAAQRKLLSSSDMIKLGLDLQGGVDFLIAIDTERLVRLELENSVESMKRELNREKVSAKVELAPQANEVKVTLDKPEDIKIASDVIERYQNLFEWDDLAKLKDGPVVLTQLSENQAEQVKNAQEASLKTIRKRVDEYGLTQPIVVKQGPDRIRVQIPGETDPDRIRAGLLRTANLEFRLLHEEHDQVVQAFIKPGSWVPEGGTGIIRDEFLEDAFREETKTTVKVLKRDIPGVPAGYRLFLGSETKQDNSGKKEVFKNLVYVLKDKTELTGGSLRRASAVFDPNDLKSPHQVTLEFDAKGTEKFAEVTTDHQGERFAILLDGEVFSAPNINEPILYGHCRITGDFSQAEATDLALTLKAGSLPAPLRVVEDQAIGASLGNDSVVDSGVALVIGAIGVIVFMVAIYSVAGVIAVLAMFLNVLVILAVMSLSNATLTLSGIGGVLLTMGMAVDANVLIYERLREELDAGRPAKAAIATAFEKAFSVILDSNITSLLPAVVLILFEVVEGSVKGFWLALAIGLIVNIYTGVTVTRALVEAWVAKRRTISVGKLRLLPNANFNFMGQRKLGLVISGVLVGISLFYIFVHGVNAGIDFTGGVTANVETTQVTRVEMAKALSADFKDVRVVKVVNKDLFQVTVPKEEDQSIDELKIALAKSFEANFGSKVKAQASQGVDPLLGSEFKATAIFTVLVASLIILGYIALRFRPIYGAGAVLALVHDLIISLGIFVLLGRSLTLDIVSALLIILGYSVNDTIVVFDRVREEVGDSYGKGVKEIINMAINKTLSRTIFTGGTSLLTILAMFLFGGFALKDFALILLLGVAIGTYSSIFVASALVYTFLEAKERKEGTVSAVGGRTKTVKIGA